MITKSVMLHPHGGANSIATGRVYCDTAVNNRIDQAVRMKQDKARQTEKDLT